MLLVALLAAPLLAASVAFFASGKDGAANSRLAIFLAFGIALLGLPLVTCMPGLAISAPWFTLFGTHAQINFSLAADGLSGWLIQLVTWITPFAILGATKMAGDRMREFAASVFAMEALMIGALLAQDLALFYLFYEGMLVPMVVIICLFGGDDRRTSALWFVLYTMAGSIMMLVALWYLAANCGTLDLALLPAKLKELPAQAQFWLFWAVVLAFAVKVPIVPLHGWQARTYAETPGAAVALLAGAMAKLGTYGLLRFVLPLFPSLSVEYAPLFITLGLVATVGGALVAMAQDDAKRMLAYSSLSHLGLVVAGIFTFEPAALNGAAVQMVAHGLSVAAIFILIGVVEQRARMTGLDDFGGLVNQTPVLAVLFIISALASAGLPGTLNFVGEFQLLLGLFQNHGGMAFPFLDWSGIAWYNPLTWLGWGVAGTLVTTIFAGLSVILGVVYLLILIQRWFYGKARQGAETFADLSAGEAFAVIPLLIASFVFGFYPAPVASQAGAAAIRLGATAQQIQLAAAPAPAVVQPAPAAPAPSATHHVP